MFFVRFLFALIILLACFGVWKIAVSGNSNSKINDRKMVSTLEIALADFMSRKVGSLSEYTVRDVSDPNLDYDEFEFAPKDESAIGVGGALALGVDKKTGAAMLLSD